MEIEEKPIKVYVKRNLEGKITNIESELFIEDFSEWEFYDEGFGDKYAHAQSQYFRTPLTDDNDNYLYE